MLEEYEYEIYYRAGKINCNADSLSRYPVCLINTNNQQLTEASKAKIISEMHDCPIGEHQGINRTMERIKLYLSWPGIEKDVKQYIKHCKKCQLNKETQKNIKMPLVVADTNMKFILTCQDNLSKYVVAVPIENQTAEKVAEAFVKNVILIYGIPNEIVTDQGTNFMSDVFKRICKLFKIEKIFTTAYHPESNGPLERTRKTLVNYLRCFCNIKTSDWDEWIPFACFTYNTTPHSVTKYTPYELLFGKIASIPGKLQQTPQTLYNFDDIVLKIKRKMQNCQQIARERLVKFKETQSQKVKSNDYNFNKNALEEISTRTL
jgi:hypothetical protein